MKIRCKNCYRVLDKNEEYCKACGAHSEQMKKAMETGNYGGGPLERFKIGITLFVILGFFGAGIVMTILAVIKNNASMTTFNRSYALLFSSIVTAIVIVLVHLKDLKDFLWNGTSKQLFASITIGLLFVVIVGLFSKLTNVTRILPSFVTDYLSSGLAKWFTGSDTTIIVLLVEFILIAIVEEIVFRRLLIDALDDATMLSDTATIILAGLFGTILDFAWVMATETIIVSLLLNMLMAGIYANSNRSLGINIALRVLIIISQFLIFLV